MKYPIVKHFSDEVDRQITQFAIDILEAMAREAEIEVNAKGEMIGLTPDQSDAFKAIFEVARQKVLGKYGLELKSPHPMRRIGDYNKPKP